MLWARRTCSDLLMNSSAARPLSVLRDQRQLALADEVPDGSEVATVPLVTSP